MHKLTYEFRKLKKIERTREKHSSKKEKKIYYSLTNYIFEIIDEIILLAINVSLVSSIIITSLTILSTLIKMAIILSLVVFLLFSILLIMGVSIDLYRIHNHYEMKKILNFEN